MLFLQLVQNFAMFFLALLKFFSQFTQVFGSRFLGVRAF